MSVVVIGAGQAGLQTIMSLRQGGYEDAITLIGDEAYLPYHCLLYTSPSPQDLSTSRMPSSA